MKINHEIFGKSDYALIDADFAVVQCVLQDDPQWGANVLELSGEFDWRVKILRLESWWRYASKIVPETSECFTVFAVVGKKTLLAYHIQRETGSTIRVTPVGYLPAWLKITTALTLAILFIAPVLLSPLVWKLYQLYILRFSKLHLDAFCRYLHAHLSPSSG